MEGYDYGARYYLPQMGTWMSADSVTPDNVGEFNGFQYVASNPLSYRDPTGHSVLTKVLKLIAKGGDLGATFYDLKVALDTLLDSNASFMNRGGALITIASEFGPVSVGDFKDIGRAVNAMDAHIDAARMARVGGDVAEQGVKAVASKTMSSSKKLGGGKKAGVGSFCPKAGRAHPPVKRRGEVQEKPPGMQVRGEARICRTLTSQRFEMMDPR